MNIVDFEAPADQEAHFKLAAAMNYCANQVGCLECRLGKNVHQAMMAATAKNRALIKRNAAELDTLRKANAELLAMLDSGQMDLRLHSVPTAD